MKKLTKFFIFLQILLSPNMFAHKRPAYIKYAHEIIDIFIKDVKKEYNLVCSATGGSMPFNVKSLYVQFISYQKATIEIARKLEVELIEKLLKMVNENKKIRPYLNEYPFKPEGIEISISFRNKDNLNYTDGSVALILQAKSKLFYCGTDENDNNYDIYEEPYSKAYEIVTGDDKYK